MTGTDMTPLRGRLRRIVEWVLDEILDRDPPPGRLWDAS